MICKFPSIWCQKMTRIDIIHPRKLKPFDYHCVWKPQLVVFPHIICQASSPQESFVWSVDNATSISKTSFLSFNTLFSVLSRLFSAFNLSICSFKSITKQIKRPAIMNFMATGFESNAMFLLEVVILVARCLLRKECSWWKSDAIINDNGGKIQRINSNRRQVSNKSDKQARTFSNFNPICHIYPFAGLPNKYTGAKI